MDVRKGCSKEMFVCASKQSIMGVKKLEKRVGVLTECRDIPFSEWAKMREKAMKHVETTVNCESR